MFILRSEFKFKQGIPNNLDQLNLIMINNTVLRTKHEFTSMREDLLNKYLNDILEYSKREKNPVKGKIVTRDPTGTFHLYKLTRKSITVTECDVNITIKNTKTPKKVTPFAEKMEILRKYVKDNRKFPGKGTIVNGVRLDSFVHKLHVDEEHVNDFQAVKQLTNGR